MKKFWLYLLITAILVFVALYWVRRLDAKVDKVTICHFEPNGRSETLNIPPEALKGHFDSQGNPLHAGDHAGVCVPPTILPTVTNAPTGTPLPSVTAEPTGSVQSSSTSTEEVRFEGETDNLGPNK